MSKLNFIGSRGWTKYVEGNVGIELFYVGTPLVFSKAYAKKWRNDEMGSFYRLLTRKYHED
jgi:hypothetical protein